MQQYGDVYVCGVATPTKMLMNTSIEGRTARSAVKGPGENTVNCTVRVIIYLV